MIASKEEDGLKKKTVWGWLLNIIFALFVLLCVGLLASVAVSKGRGSFLGFRGFIVLTGSMSPTFEAGGFVLAKEIKPQDIRVGDILVCRIDANTVLTHRVVGISNEEGYVFQTQGDANNIPDVNPVTKDQIIGMAVFWINGLGSLLLFMRRPQSIIVVFILLCAALLIPEVYREVKKKAGTYGVRDGSDSIEGEKS